MLFSRNIEPRCAYCLHSVKLDEDTVACYKRGILEAAGFCKKYRYEPTKRVPQKRAKLSSSAFSEADFEL